MFFTFLDPGRPADRHIELVLVRRVPILQSRTGVPAYRFEIRSAGGDEKVGTIDLRVGFTREIALYLGHIGYTVLSDHRGNRYAARSCRLLFPLARRHGMTPLWITCNPENLASRRTCEIAGGKLVEIIDVPEDNDQYKLGDRRKCRYRFDL